MADNLENKKAFLVAAGKAGIFGSDLETTKAEILAMIPESAMSKYEDEWEAALANLDVYLQSKGQNGTGSSQTGKVDGTGTQEQQVGSTKPVSLSSAQQTAVVNSVRDSQAQQLETSIRSEILKVLIDKPAQNTYLKKGTTVVLPISTLEKLEKYAPPKEGEDDVNRIDPKDAESIKNYKALVKAVKEQQPVELRVSDKLGSPIGVLLSRPQKGEGQSGNEEVRINKKHLTGFLTKDAFGHVPTGDSGIGAKLNIQLPRGVKKEKASAAPVIGTPVAKITGTADAVKDSKKYEIISEPDGNRTKDGTASTELGFKIKTDRTKKVNGKEVPIYRLVRMRATVSVPIWKRVEGIDVKEFGTGNRDSSVVSTPVTPAETDAYTKLVSDAQMSFLLMPAEQKIYGVSDVMEGLANAAAKGQQQQQKQDGNTEL